MKRILLLSPALYGIENYIIDTLQKKGFEVIWVENRILPFDFLSPDAKFRTLRKIYIKLTLQKERYIRKKFSTIDNLYFDVLLSINCHLFCPYLIKTLRKRHENLKTILYLWDSSSKFSCLKASKYFDQVYTFDNNDYEKYNWEYLPNFYLEKRKSHNTVQNFDLFFVGKFSQSRLLILEKIIGERINRSTKFYIKLYPAYRNSIHSYLLYMLIRIFRERNSWINNYTLHYEAITRKLNHEYLIYKALSPERVLEKLAQSNVILDLPYSNQSGYTHNAIAALVHGKKLITTNDRIKNEDFYNPDQIRIIDQKNPVVDYYWIKEKDKFGIHPYFEKLELSNWLSLLINENKAS